MAEADGLLPRIGEIRQRGGRQFFTNVYIPVGPQVESLCRRSLVRWSTSESEACCYEDAGILRLGIWAESAESAATILPVLQNSQSRPVICELIGSAAQISELEPCFVKHGWYVHNRLKRMVRPDTAPRFPHIESAAKVECAVRSDVTDLQYLMRKNLKPETSHIPDVDQMLELIDRGEVTVIRDSRQRATGGGDQGSDRGTEQGRAVAMAIFQRQGARMWYLFQLVVSSEYRGCHYGKILIKHTLQGPEQECQEQSSTAVGRNCTLWVEEANEAAVHLYHKLCFVEDGRRLVVLSSRRIPNSVEPGPQ